jgi:ABC-2 type transport system permease protein
MIQTIARKELLETLRSGRFRLAAGITLLLLVGALAAGSAQVQREAAERSAAAEADRAAWTGQGENNPHSAAHYGMWAFKPASPLAAFDPGVTPYTGTSLFMEAHAVQDARYRPAEDAPPGARLGTLSAALVLQLFIPLLLLLLAYDAFAGERERGTLRQLLSLGVRPRSLLAGKALGVALPVATVLGGALLLALVALFVVGGAAWSLPRFALLAVAYALYLTAFLGVALFVSAWATTARGALTALVAFWVVTSFLIPRLATATAEARYPTPSPAEIAEARAADMEALPDWSVRTAEVEAELMREHGVTSPDRLPVSASGYVLDWFETEETKINRRHLDALADRYERQQRVAALGGLLSPLLPVQLLSMGLSGTDYAHHRHFTDAAEAHRFAYVGQLNRDLMENQRPNERRMVGAEFWESVPSFSYTPPGAAWALGRHALSAGLLILWAALGLTLAFASVRRLRPA